jgi:NADPH2:quinone reductase
MTKMRAMAIDRFGPAEALTLHDLPIPQPKRNEVLIRVHSAGLGSWDTAMREGELSAGKDKFPLVLGLDGSGVIAARGDNVDRFEVGDKVWAYEFDNPNGGFLAEYVTIDADSVGLVPDQLDLRQAAAASVTGLTALQGIDDHLRVKEGQTVLVFGATGLVGTLAVQFALRHGARVVATASSGGGRAMLEKLGVDTVFDARKPSELETLSEFVPEGFHRVLALAGGEELNKCLELVRARGRVAYPHGVEPKPRRSKRYTLIGYDAESSPETFARLSNAVTESALRVPIAAHFPLSKAVDAFKQMETGQISGRIVIDV